MKIGIDASRAFIPERTGIEEYSYQVIKNLRDKLQNTEVVLYVRKNQKIDFDLPQNWRVKIIKFPYLWTQLGLSLELLFYPVDVLFVPSHVVPIIHPKKTIITIHGLEFEFFPQGYSFLARLYMRWSIKMSCGWASKIITVSENTKKDLMKLYKVPEDKIKVIYEGINPTIASVAKQSLDNMGNLASTGLPRRSEDGAPRNDIGQPYLLFIGRLEKRKNIEGMIEAYKILKEKYNIPHDLILAGGPGFGFEIIKLKIENYLKIKNLKLKIIKLGYVNEALKWQLLSNADIFLFPTFYEGFGLPVLEAQSVGVPVVCSNVSSLPEIVNPKAKPLASQRLSLGKSEDCSAIFCDPQSPKSIAEAVNKIISSQDLKDDIIKKGYENIRRFSWRDCGFRVSKILTNGNK